MIEIIETAPLNAVHDLGRLGTRCYGIGRSGAMDRVALAAGNAMLGNDANAAGIEVQLFPIVLRFTVDTMVAVTGADAGALLDGVPVPAFWAMPVKAGQELELVSPADGMRSYVTVAGGIDVPVVLGSRTTALRDAFGGFEGRALKAGDMLPIGAAPALSAREPAGFGAASPWHAVTRPACGDAVPDDITLRVVPAGEYEQYDEPSQAALWAQPWVVTTQSNRQGYRLQGDKALVRQPLEMRSHGIVPGVVQVPPSGQPIIQLSDGNSAGGYPKIGVVIDADLWRVAQAAPGRRLRFVPCTPALAREAERELAHYLDTLRQQSAWVRRAA